MSKIGNVVLALWIALFSAANAHAEVSISASVDKTRVAVNDSVSVSVTVSGSGNVPSPQMPDLGAFQVYSSGRSQNMSFVNGQMSSSVTHNYVLSPKSAGTFTIGAFSVTIDGKTYQTQPIQIEVTQGAPQASPSQSDGSQPARSREAPGAFVKMWVDKPRALVNEQVTLTFRFYWRVQLVGQPNFQPPTFTGFFAEDLPPPRNFTESSHGATYNVWEIRYALFPANAGKSVIQPGAIQARVPEAGQDPFFSSFFGGGREYLIKADPVTVTVEPLPALGKPVHFSGGVGDFKISAVADRRKGAVGEPLTLTVTVEGSGNLRALNDPVFPDFTGFRKYDTASSFNTTKDGGVVRGSKEFKVVLVPQVSGKQTIPPVTLEYFHAPSRQYRALRTEPIALDIAAATSREPSMPMVPAAPGAIQQVSRDIRYIKTGPLPAHPFRWHHRSKWFFPLHAVPVLVVAGALAWRGKRAVAERNPERRRLKQAFAKARAALDAARLEDTERAAQQLSDALRGYLADRMLAAPAGLTLKAVEEFLAARSTPHETVLSCRELWNTLELARYAPAQFRSVDLEGLRETARSCISAIERHLNGAPAGKFKSLILAAVLVLGATWAPSQTDREVFEQGHRLYQEGRFQEALDAYQTVRASGAENAALEYNLGNARYKTGAMGRALVHWIRAWRMDPRDDDARYNLSLVSAQTGDPFFPENIFARVLHHLLWALNLNELSVLALSLLWAAFLGWAFTLSRDERWCAPWNAALIGLWIFIFCAWSLRYRSEVSREEGVVVAAKAEVRTGPGSQFGVGFTVPEGRRVWVLSEGSGSGWMEIGVPSEGLKGWVAQPDVEKI